MKDLAESVIEDVRKMSAISREVVLREGTHVPTAVIHTMEGTITVALPFKDAHQKRALLDFVRKRAVEFHAFAVTAITCAKIVDPRSGVEEESLVFATAIQGGRPHFMVQTFSRGPDRRVVAFGEPKEGDHAAMPGQMLIVPAWEEEVRH
jgi:hypothetical protein